jgi:hypothetical protein
MDENRCTAENTPSSGGAIRVHSLSLCSLCSLGPACRSCGAVRGEERPKRESLEYHFRDLHAIDRIPLCCPVAVDIRTCASSIQTMSALLANG